MNHSPTSNAMPRLLAAIEQAPQSNVGVDTYEHLLADLLALFESGGVDRSTAAAELGQLATAWPWGAVEILEFTMHRLRWPEVRSAVENHLAHGADFRTRDLARQF